MGAALAAVKVPLLLVQSTRMLGGGKRAPLQVGESTPWLDLVRRQAPHARIEIIPGMGHFPQLEAPQIVNNYLEELISA